MTSAIASISVAPAPASTAQALMATNSFNQEPTATASTH
jgi:hypothetical protein